ncbi:MAG TPA: hypothetical protein VLH60_04470 [Sedimentisphaerales bacterium]|nr:hypothetical protein [Sedimentisphaerales bacterium]
MSATGGIPPVKTITVGEVTYALETVLKDDFFATTMLYKFHDAGQSDGPQSIILKTGRRGSFYGIPLEWLGRMLTHHEMAILGRLAGIRGVPQVLGRHGTTGFIYAFIPGSTLDHKPAIPPHFFEQLRELVDAVHSRDIAYVDMNKRGNVIVGDDTRPHLIDFQISLHLPSIFLSPLRRFLYRADYYHLSKHVIRLAPHQATIRDRELYQRRGILITLHRLLTYPYHKLRRALLRYLYSKKLLGTRDVTRYSPENDPARFLR